MLESSNAPKPKYKNCSEPEPCIDDDETNKLVPVQTQNEDETNESVPVAVLIPMNQNVDDTSKQNSTVKENLE